MVQKNNARIFLMLYSTETNLTQLCTWDISLYPAREIHGYLDLRASDKYYFVLRRKIRQEKHAHFDVILPWLISCLEYNLCRTSTYTSISLERFSETINIMKAPENHTDIALFSLQLANMLLFQRSNGQKSPLIINMVTPR